MSVARCNGMFLLPFGCIAGVSLCLFHGSLHYSFILCCLLLLYHISMFNLEPQNLLSIISWNRDFCSRIFMNVVHQTELLNTLYEMESHRVLSHVTTRVYCRKVLLSPVPHLFPSPEQDSISIA